jgi:hypothetical protein
MNYCRWEPNNTFMNITTVSKHEMKSKYLKYFKINKYKNTAPQFMKYKKAVIRRKFMMVNSYIK